MDFDKTEWDVKTESAVGIFQKADQLDELKEKKKELADLVKSTNANIKQVEEELVKLMLTEDLRNFARKGKTFYIMTSTHASSVPERKTELFEALRENNAESLIQETVNARTLSSYVSNLMDDNQDELPDWLTGLVNVYIEIGIGARKI